MTENYLTVTALTKYLKRKFDADPYLERVYLTAEISNFRMRANAHQYFSLKDQQAKINAVMFKNAFQGLKFTPEEGMKVLVIGRISLYEASGNYQIYVEHMEPDGVGALYQALEELKKKLTLEGLLDAPKKYLPKYPKKIAVITSPSGAVIRDILTTVKRRYPIAQVVLYPTLVQGSQAADNIVKNIERVDFAGDYDTMIVARGGGSIEDLWPFNEEKVARAIFNAQTPVISSVGHETDVTIADLVADVRAATPTAAAELAVPVLTEEIMKINQLQNRLIQGTTRKIELAQNQLKRLTDSYVFRQPERLYESYAQKLDFLKESLNNNFSKKVTDLQRQLDLLMMRQKNSQPTTLIQKQQETLALLNTQLNQNMSRYMTEKQQRFAVSLQSLDHLSPLKIMGRGYSYVLKDKAVIKSAEQLTIGDTIQVRFAKGSVAAEIIEKMEEEE